MRKYDNYFYDPVWGWTRAKSLDRLCGEQRKLYLWSKNPNNFKGGEYFPTLETLPVPRYSYITARDESDNFRRFHLLKNGEIVFTSSGENTFNAFANGIQEIQLTYPDWLTFMIPSKKESLMTQLKSLKLIRQHRKSVAI